MVTSDNWGVIVRFGEVEISGARIIGNVSQPNSGPNTIELVIPNDLLIAAKPDYQAMVRIFACRGAERYAMFTGYVDRVSLEDGSTRISCVSQSQFASEVALGGFGYRDVDPLEIVWAMVRFTGFAPEDITIEGWAPGPAETFEVSAAIEGLTLDEPVALGRVTLVPDDGIASRLADDMQPATLRTRYAEGPVWALVFRTARTLLEADTEGTREIDLALAWLTARTRYSSVVLPGGELPLSFGRHWTLSHVQQRDVVVARGLTTNRKWIRAQRHLPSSPKLTLEEIDDLEAPALPPDVPVEVSVAISAWRRAVGTSDPVEAVVALWEAIEFYASGTKVEKLFAPSELRTIRDNATEGLSDPKKYRVEHVLGMLNQAPLMVRLQEALEEDGVPYTEEELDVLRRVLSKRSDLHGRSREAPPESDLRYAVAIVNRMLVHRVARSNESDEGP
jgi:hypothetical protein